MSKNLTAVIEKTSTGFSGYFKEFDGLFSVGGSINELKDNLQDVLSIEIDYLEEKGMNASHLKGEILYTADLEQFFEHYKVINKSAFAEYIGMNRSLFSQYINGLTDLSSEKMLQITNGLHNLAKDIEDIVLV